MFVLVLGAASIPLLLRRSPERAEGPIPEPVAPFGLASRAGLEFRWAIPADAAPVRVEVFDAGRVRIFRSEPTLSGALRPPESVRARLPLADLLWMPVAMPVGGAERPGDLAAFTLVP